MKAINLLPTDLLAIPVEQNATNFKKTKSLTYYLQYEMNGFKYVEPIERDFKILGCITKDHIDFDVEPCVQAVGDDDYKDYTHHINVYADEKDSFRSLLSSNGLYFVNPLGEKRPYKEASLQDASEAIKTLDNWITAESNIVQKLLIIKLK